MSFLQKTFGGITKAFYWRQFVFGLIFYLPLISMYWKPNPALGEQTGVRIFTIFILSVMQFLYPYARFVYHSITDFLMGNNVIIMPIIILYPFKFMMMLLCWVFSPFIAPLGLLYLYFYHSKNEKN